MLDPSRRPLYSAEMIPTAEAVRGLIAVLLPDAETALDVTYGSGKFWAGPSALTVTGLDRVPSRAPDVVGDFTRLPFRDESFDLVCFDPPYQTDMGRGKASVMGDRFGTFATLSDLRLAVALGAAEAYRVCRLGVLVKVQNYIHASKFVPMTDWVKAALPVPLYDELHVIRPHKIVDPKWDEQFSVYRNHATFLVFRRGSQYHRRRGPVRLPRLAETGTPTAPEVAEVPALWEIAEGAS